MLFFKNNDKDNEDDGQIYCYNYIGNNGGVVIFIVWCINLCNKKLVFVILILYYCGR